MFLTPSRGFTVVELMVTLVVLAIVLAIGTPSMRTFIANARIKTAGESWKYGLTLARNEAVRLNQQVEFVTDATGWQVRRVRDETVLHRGTGKEGVRGLQLEIAPADAARVTYDAFGRVLDPNPDGTDPMRQVDIRADREPTAAGYRPLRLQVLAGGATRLCDPAAEADDPRACL